MTVPAGRCGDTHNGCPCKGDAVVHAARAAERTAAREQAEQLVECPECGAPGAPLAIVTWGHCRACRTAQSREMYPLRW